ncbi:dihydroorotate dehydrogenase [Vampirovibrio chlorellavorus]|uniref:dihydroorotate dehydrogenase n=1 Tax=Vampirovibrio chlorellavorus TaxID=758823 RepID=UPI0026E9B963|nr:dihydroorotate dehydrogenase [Vampirovibrio chlorellavorus]
MSTVMPSLSISAAGLSFHSPLLNASGTFNAPLFNQLFPLKAVMGGIVTKTVTQNPQAGNLQPRTTELPGIGMLNSIGLQNPGLAYSLETEIPELKAMGLPVILSISANSSAEFAQMIETTLSHPHAAQIDAIELNLSCPNVAKGGIHFGSAADSVKEALSAVTGICPKPVFAKLTPNVSDIVSIGAAAIEGGAAGLTAINTVLGVAIDIHQKKPVMPRVSAGYSGPGIKPIALHAIWNLHKHFPETPIIGVGGISNAQDVLEFLMAGASLVQVGTICFRQPTIFKTIQSDLQAFCRTENLDSLNKLIGCAHGE